MNVKALRMKAGLSQQELSDKTGIAKGRINNWEQGKGNPKRDDYNTLIEFFKGIENIAQDKSIPKNESMNNIKVYQTIVEGHTEYVLIPRKVMENTQLISSEQLNKTWDELAKKNEELERKNQQIDFYQQHLSKYINSLELASKPSNVKEIKQKH